jgi:hypothetical protein
MSFARDLAILRIGGGLKAEPMPILPELEIGSSKYMPVDVPRRYDYRLNEMPLHHGSTRGHVATRS